MDNFKQIHKYLSGQLSANEIAELWIEFLKDPELYELFQIELHLKHIISNK